MQGAGGATLDLEHGLGKGELPGGDVHVWPPLPLCYPEVPFFDTFAGDAPGNTCGDGPNGVHYSGGVSASVERLTFPMAIRIVVTDDHAVVRQGLRMFLELDPELEVVGEAANGVEALALAKALQPDVVLMDLLMPVMDGITAIGKLREETPGVEVIALTSVLEDASVVGAVRAGATGYLLKDTNADELRRAVKAAAAGQVQLSPEAATRLMREVRAPEKSESLTERETDVLRLLARGQANKEIARDLAIGEKTVKTHVSSILSKLGVQSRTQAVLHAMKVGLIPHQ